MTESAISVNGRRKLFGEVKIQGSKNSALPCLTACCLCDSGKCCVRNCPYLSDVQNTMEILEELGCYCNYDNTREIVEVCVDGFFGDTIETEMMNRMRSSILFLGAILCKNGEAHVGFPGGCELGARPIDMHLSAFESLGVDIEEECGMIHCRIKNKLVPTAVSLICPSVGATENIMLLMAKSDGVTIIRNAAREPEILDLQNLLNSMGADIKGAGSDAIVISGVKSLHAADFSVMPDRIVAGTYMAAAVGCGGRIFLRDANFEHCAMCGYVLKEMGAMITSDKSGIYIEMNKRPMAVKTVKTLYYPGFPTDAQPQFMAVSAVANGTTVFVESIFENRFRHAGELKRMGADIDVRNCQAIVRGRESLSGTEVRAYDLRGGAAMVVAGLEADGNTRVTGINHIERGYKNIVGDLKSLGADINLIV